MDNELIEILENWQEPITDRVAQDALDAKLGIDNSKGFFQAVDWNRIKGNQTVVKSLMDYWNNIVVVIVDVYVHTQTGTQELATDDSWITDIDMNNIAQNIITLADAFPYSITNYVIPKTSYIGGLGATATSPDWSDINTLETDIKLLYDLIYGSISMWRYSGEVICSSDSEQIDVL